jgi:hypothetical protein
LPHDLGWRATTSPAQVTTTSAEEPPKGAVRWRVVSSDGRVSPSFKLRIQGHDAYVAQRSLKNIKVSLHTKTGDAHAAFMDHETSEAWTGEVGTKWLSDWKANHEFVPGWQELFSVIHPEPELRKFDEDGIDKVEDLIDLPVPAGMSLAMTLFRSHPVAQATQVTFEDACHVATFDAGELQFHLMALLHPWTGEHRQWASNARRINPGTTSYSLAPPGGFNIDSPAARLLKLVKNTHGGRWYVDLAAKEPEAVFPKVP